MESLFFLNEKIKAYDRIIIYGTGRASWEILTKMLQYNVKVECFADSNPDNCGKKIMNIPVFHINELLDMNEDAAIIVGGIYIFEIVPELEKLGFKHIFFDYTNGIGYIHLERDDN